MHTTSAFKKTLCILLCFVLLGSAWTFSCAATEEEISADQIYFIGTPSVQVARAQGTTVYTLTVRYSVPLAESPDGEDTPILTAFDPALCVHVDVLALDTPIAAYTAKVAALDPAEGEMTLDLFAQDGTAGAPMFCLGMPNPYVYALNGSMQIVPTDVMFAYRFTFPQGLLRGENAVSAAVERELDVGDLPVFEQPLIDMRLVTGTVDLLRKVVQFPLLLKLLNRILERIIKRIDKLENMKERNPFKWIGMLLYGLPTLVLVIPIGAHVFQVIQSALGVFGASWATLFHAYT